MNMLLSKLRVVNVGSLVVCFVVLTFTYGSMVIAQEFVKGSASSIKVCVLPFMVHDTTLCLGDDLASMLASDLATAGFVETVPSHKLYETLYRIDPGLFRGDFEKGQDRWKLDTVSLYGYPREVIIQKIRPMLHPDFVVFGEMAHLGKSWVFQAHLYAAPFQDKGFHASQEGTEEQAREAVKALSGKIVVPLDREYARREAYSIRDGYCAKILSLESAVDQMGLLLNRHPENLTIRILRLSLYGENPGKYQEPMREEAGKVVERTDPSDQNTQRLMLELDLDPFGELCKVYAESKDWDRVLRIAEMGINKFPLRERVYRIWRIRASLETGRYQQARKDIEEMLQEDPSNVMLLQLKEKLPSP
jgi:tetratricopeptide (TPR) repeat protein